MSPPPASRRAGAPRKGTLRHAVFGLWMLLWSFTPVAVVIALYVRRPSVWTFALAFVVVAARQNALFVVAHESWHRNLFPWRRANEVAGAWLAAYPIVLPYWQARHAHLEHHRTVGTAADPDRYAWGWGMGDRRAFVGNLLSVATFSFALRIVRRLLVMPPAPLRPGRAPRIVYDVPEGRFDLVKVAVTHAAILGAFSAVSLTAGYQLYLGLWLAPALTLRMAIDELRQFLEHRGGRLIIYRRAGMIERFVLGPFNFHLHAWHHALAAEPWFDIPRVGARARSKDPSILELGTYTGELAAYLRGRDSTAPSAVRAEDAATRASSSSAL